MRIRNQTPFLFGYRPTARRPSRPEMTAIVRGTFVIVPGGPVAVPEGIPLLVQGAMTGEVYRDDDEDRSGECLYPDDFARVKPRAEVLLRGTCHTPNGAPLPECPVRFVVGGWSKLLRILGPRVWTDSVVGSPFTDPIPFTRMPIGYTHAFGGPGHAPNPAGKGVGTAELPNVEHAGEIVRTRRDRPAPAGFGPINAAWPPRAGKLGRAYGKGHRRHSPAFAEDLDLSYFQAAPPDQQLDAPLRGDEELVFQNLHPTLPVLTTRLPGLRVRVFVKDRRGAVREPALRLDTLFADTDKGTVTVTWRGLLPVEEPDLDDVTTVLLASERLAEPPLPESHYRDAIERYEADPLRVREVMPEGLRDVAEQAVYHGRLAAPLDAASGDPLSAALHDRLAHLPPAAQEQIREGIARLRSAPMPSGVDLDAEIARAIAEMPPPPAAPAGPPAQGVFPLRDASIGRSVAKVRALLDRLKEEGRAKGIALQGVEKYERVLEDLRALDLPGDETRGAPPEEPGPGRDLSSQDLSGRDLRGRDLRGARLDRAILARADLREARLEGASLREAVLIEADLTGADLSKTDLYRANLGGARAPGVSLREARLEQTILDRADLTGAILAGASGEMVLVGEADLTGVDARGARFHKSLFRQATLTRADFSGATLTRSSFLRCNAAEARFDGADLARAGFTESDLRGARLTGVRGERAGFLHATLEGADLGHASLPSAALREAKVTRSRLHGVNLRGANLYRAHLEGVDLTGANLAGAVLTRATLRESLLVDANLHAADLTQGDRAGSDFTGANLTRCSLEDE